MIRHFCTLLSLAAVLAAGQMNEAQAAPVSHSCGAVISSRVKTETVEFATNNPSFVNVPGAQTTVVVPTGETYCVKIRFSAMMRCTISDMPDICFIRAVAADPAIDGVAFGGEDSLYSAKSFQWIRKLGAGTYTVRVQAAVEYPTTFFSIQSWTLDVETTE